MDATDYLKTTEVQEMMEALRQQVVADSKEKDLVKLEQEVQAQLAALRETLLADLPDQYLSPEELRDREQRQANPPG